MIQSIDHYFRIGCFLGCCTVWCGGWTPWRWRQQSPPKRSYPTIKVHGTRTQNTTKSTFTAVKASDLAPYLRYVYIHRCSLWMSLCFNHSLGYWCTSRNVRRQVVGHDIHVTN